MTNSVKGSLGLQSHIWSNNTKSAILLAGFPVLIFLVTAIIVGTDHYFSSVNRGFTPDKIEMAEVSIRNTFMISHWIILGTLAWFAIAYFAHSSMISRMTGSHPVNRKENPELYNLLENLCISRGMKTPKLNIMQTPMLNAFASGLNEKTYTVTVTQGLLDTLDKKELEAVLAHELSHIINKDVRLMIIAIIFVGIFSTLTEMLFRGLLRGSGRRSNGKNGGALVLVALVALAIGYLLATLIRFSISRKREYLADAGAVELTKNPEAMISALKKISGKASLDDVPDEVRGMFIENPPKFKNFQTGFFSMFATHPPIETRIDVLHRLS